MSPSYCLHFNFSLYIWITYVSALVSDPVTCTQFRKEKLHVLYIAALVLCNQLFYKGTGWAFLNFKLDLPFTVEYMYLCIQTCIYRLKVILTCNFAFSQHIVKTFPKYTKKFYIESSKISSQEDLTLKGFGLVLLCF